MYFIVRYDEYNKSFFLEKLNAYDLSSITKEPLNLIYDDRENSGYTKPYPGFISYDNFIFGYYHIGDATYKMIDIFSGDIFEITIGCEEDRYSNSGMITNGKILQARPDCKDNYFMNVYDLKGNLIVEDTGFNTIDNEKGITIDYDNNRLLIHRFDWDWNEYHALDLSCD